MKVSAYDLSLLPPDVNEPLPASFGFNGVMLHGETLDQVQALMSGGHKIAAILLVRGTTGCGLVEGREYVEALALSAAAPDPYADYEPETDNSDIPF
jgi:hypothetical protein